MFEKSLYDLIRGLRNHRGNEREYIQACIRECRAEIKGQDMDIKTIAVLKLTYLEMFGHDMSWASFNILEVMSSQKYLQKRVGYLGAVQSFRPDTEVLMLAENLLKKDLTSPTLINIALPLAAIPHVINPSMANSLLSDLLARLSHSSPSIRKKTIVTLYRLALVYPETLRPAWPKIKERLLDDNEDASVTAAVVNVVCELGWRRPHDFLPLAPRLFDLLVSGTNNWMAIKIIKLFATLTPLEPRLVKKLLPPLTNLIRTTPAMSLLYECINGIIQGRILENQQGTTEGDELARLCVGKLRGMLMIEGDPNLKYVALLAFAQIVEMHPYLVTSQSDVVLECIDDVDISIRLKALDLVQGMVSPQNLVVIVEKLMSQLHNSPLASSVDDPANERNGTSSLVPMADSDDSDMEQSIRRSNKKKTGPPPLPDEYRRSVIHKILDMCARDTYANINDFDWYIEILVQLVRHVPATSIGVDGASKDISSEASESTRESVAHKIGTELRNVAIRVKSSRAEATHAAELLVSTDRRASLFPPVGTEGFGVLEPAVWIAGEFASLLTNPSSLMDSLLHSSTLQLPSDILSSYLQATVKVFSFLTGNERLSWTSERKTMVSLFAARVTHFFESLVTHPSLEVQERAAEYLELTRLATEAIAGHAVDPDYSQFTDPPLLLTRGIPALFTGMELNPVAKEAQRKVPLPENVDLDQPLNEDLHQLLQVSDLTFEDDADEFTTYYFERPAPTTIAVEPAANRLNAVEMEYSYQQSAGDDEDVEMLMKRKAERRERYKDDPYYIPSEENSGRATPIHKILQASNGTELDVDSIPIMKLELDAGESEPRSPLRSGKSTDSGHRKARKKFEILGDETIGGGAGEVAAPRPAMASRTQRSLLQVDSSGLGSLSLGGEGAGAGRLDAEKRAAEEAEMAQAMQEVERLRLEMQRNAERIESVNGPAEETVVRRKKKKVAAKVAAPHEAVPASEEAVVARPKKKKKKIAVLAADQDGDTGEAVATAPAITMATVKKKKKKRPAFQGDIDGSDPAMPVD